MERGVRMKKVLTAIALAAIVFAALLPQAAPVARADQAVVFAEDFDDTTNGQLPQGWTGTTGADGVAVAEEAGGNKYLASTETANGTPNTATVSFAPVTSSLTADVRVMAQQTHSTAWFLTLRDGSGAKAVEILYDQSRFARRLPDNTHGFLRTYTANQWYDVHVEIDMAAQTYEVAIDGQTLVSGVPLLNPVSEISQYSFATYRFQSGTFRVDDLVISAEVEDPSNLPPTAENVAISGTPEPGETLTGSYVYADAESDAEGASTFRWYRSLQANGSDRTVIPGATSPSYTVTSADEGHYLFFEVTPVASSGTLQGSPVLSAPVYVGLTETITGHSISFDANGRFTDGLDQLNHVFSHRGIALGGGSARGIGGELSYYSPDADIERIAIDVTYNKWVLNFTLPDELKVVETVYDSNTGTWSDGDEVVLLRQLRPHQMTGVQYVKATYVSTSINPGTRYLKVKLPTAGFFGSSATAADFKVDGIVLESPFAVTAQAEGYLIDEAADFSLYADGVDTSNLNAVQLNPATDMAAIRTFGDTTYVRRNNSNVVTQAMMYEAPEGKQFLSAYLEGYYFQSLLANPFELWISADGTNFTRFNMAGIYLHPAFGSSTNNSIPDVLQANFLPDGVKYVQVRLPAAGSGGFPYMTKLAFGYGPEVAVPPVDTDVTIRQAASAIAIDGVVETDASGAPIGEWAGGERIRIAGVVDNNGDRHGADVYLKYDAEKLYVAAIVKDPTPMRNVRTGTGIWNGDVLELFMGDEDLDMTTYPDMADTMIPSDRQIVLGSGIDYGNQSYVHTNGVNSFPAIIMDIKKDADGKGYVMEASIPLESIGFLRPWEGRELILNAVLSDGNYASRGQWGWTTVGEPTKKARGQWGTARFETAAAPAAQISVTASVDNATQLVTITGTVNEPGVRQMSLLVKDPSGAVDHVDQAATAADGSFTFQYTLNRDASGNGTYAVLVGGQGIVLPHEASFTFTYEEPAAGLQGNGAPPAGLMAIHTARPGGGER
jgi:hypothetical protein